MVDNHRYSVEVDKNSHIPFIH